MAWFDSLLSSFYLPNFAGVAKRCCIDLVYFSTLLPSGDDFSLKLLVSDFVVELQEQLLYGEDDHRVSTIPYPRSSPSAGLTRSPFFTIRTLA